MLKAPFRLNISSRSASTHEFKIAARTFLIRRCSSDVMHKIYLQNFEQSKNEKPMKTPSQRHNTDKHLIIFFLFQVEAGDVILKVNGDDVHLYSTKEGKFSHHR